MTPNYQNVLYRKLEDLTNAKEDLRQGFPKTTIELESPIQPDQNKRGLETKPETSCFSDVR